ncbi:hypothetical protein [Nannocystis bainbridge]|uniref:Uncharacterized protein n=1 Tax=Nannocystis bainbridge TaxID=2995303 RepID=A0ABT5DXL0_9BACT|nr:hypothetical protein [Nannocystis bainbridge]MDC0717182.1 hypothetical protein [Nannocystis bainbridge]
MRQRRPAGPPPAGRRFLWSRSAPLGERRVLGDGARAFGTTRLTTHHEFYSEILAYDAFGAEEYAIAEGTLFVRPGPQNCFGPI